MLQKLYSGLDKTFNNPPLYKHRWDVLQYLWTNNTVQFTNDGLNWSITEYLEEEVVFSMDRSIVSHQRNTKADKYGLLGTSLLNLNDTSVILTEGVSDFFTAKILCPDRNVLGVTTLGGSVNAKKILISLFDSFLICADADNSGRSVSFGWKTLLESYNKSVTIFTPPVGSKDITESFVLNLKLAYLS